MSQETSTIAAKPGMVLRKIEETAPPVDWFDGTLSQEFWRKAPIGTVYYIVRLADCRNREMGRLVHLESVAEGPRVFSWMPINWLTTERFEVLPFNI